jgi:hypothetical protein
VTPIRTSACNATFVLGGCDDLPARKDDEFGMPTISTYWRPDAEELAAIAAGLPIKLTVIGTNPQPVRLEVDAL